MDDYKETFDNTANLLRDQGYELVVDQVNEELSTGRFTEEKIKTLKESDSKVVDLLSANDFKKGQTAEFVRRVDYSDADALALLLEAAKRAIIDPTIMIADIHTFLADFNLQGAALESDRSDYLQEINLPQKIDRQQATVRATEMDQLARMIRRVS